MSDIVAGNLTADPQIYFTAAGKAWVKFTIADTARVKDADGKWVDGATTYYVVKAWDNNYSRLAMNAADSLTKGDRVVVIGKLAEESWTGRDGKARTDMVIAANDLGVSLLRGVAKVNRAVRSSQAQVDAWATEDPGF